MLRILLCGVQVAALPAWDGVPRVETLFIDYLNFPDTPYIRAIARKMLVAAVARIYDLASVQA